MVQKVMRPAPPLPELEVAQVEHGSTLAIRLRFKGGGWATFYIDDDQGTLALVSDWGSWAHRWGRGSWLGVDPPDLSRALLHLTERNSSDYVPRKLFMGVRDQYDEQETRRDVTRHILQSRRDRPARHSRASAREAYDHLDSIEWGSEHHVAEALTEWPLDDFFQSDFYEHIVYSPPSSYFVVRDQLVPAFHEALARYLDARAMTRRAHEPAPAATETEAPS